MYKTIPDNHIKWKECKITSVSNVVFVIQSNYKKIPPKFHFFKISKFEMLNTNARKKYFDKNKALVDKINGGLMIME